MHYDGLQASIGEFHMTEALKDKWTIVVLGTWNTSIFSVAWLGKNVFGARELLLEVGTEPGVPRRVTADDVVVIPSDSRLIVVPKNLEETTLVKAERVACKILELLKHTPINAVGVNFGYRVNPLPQQLRERLPSLLGAELAVENLVIKARDYVWTVQSDPGVLNIRASIEGDEAVISFNFNLSTHETEAAAKYVDGNVIKFRDKTKAILDGVFKVFAEEKS